MGMNVKKKLGFVFFVFIAVASIVVSAPSVSYAQPKGLAGIAKAQAAEDLADTAMKEIEKNIANTLGKKSVPEADKANITKKILYIAKSAVNKLIDEKASGELPEIEELVNTVMEEIQSELAAIITDTKNVQTVAVPPESVSQPEPVSVTEAVPMFASEPAPSAPPQPREISADWRVNSTKTWIEMINGVVKAGGNGKTYTVAVSGDISVPVNNGNTFGSVKQVTVILDGRGTLSPSGDGKLLGVGAGQTISVRGALNLRGRDNNISSVVVVDSGGTFRIGGNAAVTGNAKKGGDGGGVLVRSGSFIMNENSSVSDNSVKGSGGGVFIYDGEFEMQDSAKVSGNAANNGGGGVYVENGKFVMTDAAMVSSNTVWLGGGVYVGSAGVFVMRGSAKVSGNTVYRQGGGVYFAGKDFTVEENAAVSGNAASRHGREIYFAGQTFKSRDGAKVSANTAGVGSGVYFAGKVPIKSAGGSDGDNK